jgi:sterol desaturase/sphingolipid hydroxylase (fatty acid hydroxylase superfamily)
MAALPDWAFELVRYGNGLLLLAAVFVPLERLFALRPAPVLRAGWRTDIVWYFLTSWLPGRAIVLAVALLVVALGARAPQGLFPALGNLPPWARWPLAFVVAEIGFYWGHRWMHASPRLWRFHALHHGATGLDWLVNTRVHPVDLIVTRLCGLLPLYLLGLARSGGGEVDALPLGVLLVASAWGYLIHANLRWRFGVLEQFIATPAFHHWHHQHLGGQGHHGHGNYAPTLPLLDRLFGTLYLPAAWPARYGTDEPARPLWLDQLMAPFMEVFDSLRPSTRRQR